MAKAFSELVALTGANLSASDIRALTDVSDTTQAASGSTKGITVGEDQKGLWRLFPEKIPFHFDGGGSAIADGTIREWIVPYDCTILGWTVVADQTGSISISLRNESYANYSASIPDSGDSIVASAPIALSSAIKNADTTLTGWVTTLAGGSILRWVVSGVTSITRLSGVLHIQRTA
jgi:hypothetical protein